MEFYLQAKVELGQNQRRLTEAFERKVLDPEYLKLYLERRNRREENPEAVVTVELSGDTARVVTTGRPRSIPKQQRYHLRPSANGWQIHEIEWECLLCAGTGALNGIKCGTCRGTGWKDPLTPDD
jgi:hypothetical protein